MIEEIVENIIEIPEKVQLALVGTNVTITGKKGSIQKNFAHTKIAMQLEDKKLKLSFRNPRKAETALIGTISAHIKNMIKGVTDGFTYKMKIVFVHFPMNVKVVGKEIHLENFLGEKKPRVVKILGNAKVSIKQDDIIIEGIDIEHVSQTAANIQQKSKVKNKDLRKFLDGAYIYSKV